MKRTLIYVVAAFCTVTTAAQENYTAIQEIKGTINHIKVLSKMNVKVETGLQNSISISQNGKNNLNYPICKINDNVLELNNPNEEIQNLYVKITLTPPMEINSLYAAENSTLILEYLGGKMDLSTISINAQPNSVIQVVANLAIWGEMNLTAAKNAVIMIDKIDGKQTNKVSIKAEDGANILVKRGELGEMTKVSADIAKSSSVIIPGKEFKTTEKSTYYYDTKDNTGKEMVITTTTVENTAKDADKKSSKSEKNDSKCGKTSYPNVNTLSFGAGLSYLSGANNPKSFENSLNTGNTDIALAGGTRWYFTFIVPINFSQHFSLNTGIGMEFNRFSFEKNVSADRLSDGTYALCNTGNLVNQNGITNYEANLYAQYFTVPLVFQWSAGKKFAINLGVIGGLKYFSSFKTYFEAGDVEIDAKFSDYNNINPLKADAILGFTIHNFGINFRYALTSLFKSGREEIVYPFSVGVCWGI
ncbi:MAG: outer membrane beta-barrel protein [Bacteroidales bacterium]|jgi:hypothetical protein|nr:outer membrane beta-barrel protein [Bacteroidales bacterium]